MTIDFTGKPQEDIIFDITRSGSTFFHPGWIRMFGTKIHDAVGNVIITSEWAGPEQVDRFYTIRKVSPATFEATAQYPLAPRWELHIIGAESSGWNESCQSGNKAYPTLRAARAALKRYLAHKEASWQY